MPETSEFDVTMRSDDVRLVAYVLKAEAERMLAQKRGGLNRERVIQFALALGAIAKPYQKSCDSADGRRSACAAMAAVDIAELVERLNKSAA